MKSVCAEHCLNLFYYSKGKIKSRTFKDLLYTSRCVHNSSTRNSLVIEGHFLSLFYNFLCFSPFPLINNAYCSTAQNIVGTMNKSSTQVLYVQDRSTVVLPETRKDGENVSLCFFSVSSSPPVSHVRKLFFYHKPHRCQATKMISVCGQESCRRSLLTLLHAWAKYTGKLFMRV